MKQIIFYLFKLISITTMAQTTVQGGYIFTRREMAAGFNFFAKGRFDFFYSYGAIDRTASGTFTVEKDTVKLRSDKEPGKDFTVTSQRKEGEGYIIQFEDSNKFLLSNIRCSFFIGTERHDEFTDENGTIKANYPNCDKIYVFHQLFPDMVTLIKDEQNENNRFKLILNPSLSQVSFQGIDLKITDTNTLTCIPNYLMMMEDITFKKQ